MSGAAAAHSGGWAGARERTDASVEALVAAFEACTVQHEEWTHVAHLAVAVYYASRFGAAEALDRMRAGLLRLNAAHGVPQTPERGYHETITRFYMHEASRYVRHAPPGSGPGALADGFVAAAGDRSLPFRHYSRERLLSWAARTAWVEPDLRPLD